MFPISCGWTSCFFRHDRLGIGEKSIQISLKSVNDRTEELAHIKRREEGCVSIETSRVVVIDSKGLVKNYFGVVFFFFGVNSGKKIVNQ